MTPRIISAIPAKAPIVGISSGTPTTIQCRVHTPLRISTSPYDGGNFHQYRASHLHGAVRRERPRNYSRSFTRCEVSDCCSGPNHAGHRRLLREEQLGYGSSYVRNLWHDGTGPLP